LPGLANILITGGCGFIGSNFIRYLFSKTDFSGIIIKLDKLTYAGNPQNLSDLEERYGGSRYFFEHGDICDEGLVDRVFSRHSIDTVLHFAAESHVDRSIYGPYQFPEKLIPLMILNMLEERPLPVYGDGKNVRDWIYVDAHSEAVWRIMRLSPAGECYNIGGENEWENIRLVETLCEKVGEAAGKGKDYYKGLISFVKDRPGHDRRYAINCDKIKSRLKWRRRYIFEQGIEQTVSRYLNNREWVESVRTGEYRQWVEKNYGRRN